jgi:bifunctional UDP-N-acetylglucosamine pyrophosphorylase / glucosamine-1-phosphate N-acetyltransferase
MSCSVIVLGAGQGKRMCSSYSKVLHQLGNTSFIQRVINTAKLLSPDALIVVHGHQGHQVKEALHQEQILWAEQMPPQGTGHAVQQALPFLPASGETIILYGDVPLIQADTLRAMLEVARNNALALLVMKMDDPTGYGRIIRNPTGKITGIIEEKDASAEEKQIKEINTGMMALPTAWLHQHLSKLDNNNAQKEYYLTDLIKIVAHSGGAIEALYPTYSWEVTGVNDRIQQAALEREYQHFQANSLMKKGVSLKDPNRFDLRGELECGQDTEIDINCIFEGKVVLGSNVKIGAQCVIKNSTIENNVIIEPFSHLDGVYVSQDAKVGPFARLRPGTSLGKDTHVGNFVEIKNSVVDESSKINHLTYVGDADVGKHVNIGAGTITCNYDGAKKHRTKISDHVFVGSATQLVAPVFLAQGVTVAAGTTVWKNVDDQNVLVLNKKEQCHQMGWQRPKKIEGK